LNAKESPAPAPGFFVVGLAAHLALRAALLNHQALIQHPGVLGLVPPGIAFGAGFVYYAVEWAVATNLARLVVMHHRF
jgi:hypothetical protein